jgi:hypothetical protein
MIQFKALAAFPMCLALGVGAALAQDSVKIKEAALISKLADQRPMKSGFLSPPAGQLFAWLSLDVPGGTSLPLVLELLKTELVDASNQRFRLVGLAPYDLGASVTVMLTPVSQGGGPQSEVTDSSNSSTEDVELSVRNSGPTEARSARLTVKKPTVFTLVFLVPAKGSTFSLNGLASKPLIVGRLDVPK